MTGDNLLTLLQCMIWYQVTEIYATLQCPFFNAGKDPHIESLLYAVVR